MCYWSEESLRQKTRQFDQYFESKCQNDPQCQLLRSKLLQAYDSKKFFLTKELTAIHSLVKEICQRLSFESIYAIWIDCSKMILKYWSSFASTLKGKDLIRYTLVCWQRFSQSTNQIYSTTIYVQYLAFKTMQCKIMKIMAFLFTEYFIENGNYLFDSIMMAFECEHHQIRQSHSEGELSIRNSLQNHSDLSTNDLQAMLFLLIELDNENHLVFYRSFALPYVHRLMLSYGKKIKEKIAITDQDQQTGQSDLIQHLDYIETSFNKEMFIARKYSFPLPMIRIEAKLLFDTLIRNHQSIICDYARLQTILDFSNDDEDHNQVLRNLYEIVQHDEISLKELAKNLQQYFDQKLSILSFQFMNQKQPTSIEEIIQFGFDCLILFQRSECLCSEIFKNNRVIHKSTTESFHNFLNSNNRIVCLLSLFIHLISMNKTSSYLSTSTIYPDQSVSNFAMKRKDLIRKFFPLFALIEDQKAVVHYNRRFLSQRILFDLTCSIEEDVDLIGFLFESIQIADNTCDVKLLLKDYQQSYYQSVTKSTKFFDVALLNRSVWDLNDAYCNNHIFSSEFFLLFNEFERYFHTIETNSNLKVLPEFSTALLNVHLRSSVVDESKKIYPKFWVTLKQLSILMFFNSADQIRLKEIKEKIFFKAEELESILKTFTKFGLLRKESISGEEDGEDSSRYIIVENFSFEGIVEKYSGHEIINWIKLEHQVKDYFIDSLVDEYFGHREPRTSIKSARINSILRSQQNAFDYGLRVEAAIVRLLKRFRSIPSIETLRRRIIENFFSHPSGPSILKKRKAEFRKIVESLEKQGYLSILPNGQIDYKL